MNGRESSPAARCFDFAQHDKRGRLELLPDSRLPSSPPWYVGSHAQCDIRHGLKSFPITPQSKPDARIVAHRSRLGRVFMNLALAVGLMKRQYSPARQAGVNRLTARQDLSGLLSRNQQKEAMEGTTRASRHQATLA